MDGREGRQLRPAQFARARKQWHRNDGADATFHHEGGHVMSIAKVIELSSSSPKGIEDAIRDGLKRASKTINNIKGAWVNDIKVVTDETGKITEWRVNMRVNFVLG
jgi:flavin-binding protein dodecin